MEQLDIILGVLSISFRCHLKGEDGVGFLCGVCPGRIIFVSFLEELEDI